jgi:GWxTD domain-containing protein
LLAVGLPLAASAQETTDDGLIKTDAPGLTDSEREKREASLERELSGAFKKWLDEDVNYIITDEERQAFRRLSNDEEREQFIEQFWLRRNPDPESLANDYREEHYRRIAYSNQHFASGIPGWKTDRGRIYIMYGPPDEIEAHASGGFYQRPIEEGGGSTSTYPFEQWRYRYIEGVGQNIVLEFVDPTLTGEYRMTMDPAEKDALLYVPGAGLSEMEALGLSSKVDRFTRTDGTRLPRRMIDGSPGAGYATMHGTQFDRLALFANINRPPEIKFKDLEELVSTNIRFNLLPFQVRSDYVKVTDDTVLAGLTISLTNKDLSFQNNTGVQHATVNIFGRITTLTRRVVQTFEDTMVLDIPDSLLEQSLPKPAVYWKALPLRPGLYRLSLAVKDVNSGNTGTMELRMEVPQYVEDQLSTSSLILADQIEKVSTKRVGLGPFVIGDTKVRPAVGDTFTRDQKLGIYLQVYNMKPDETGNKPAATIEYSLLKGDQSILQLQEQAAALPDASPFQAVVEKLLPLNALEPGKYKLQIRVTDNVTNRVVSPSAEFTVQ